MKLFVLLCLCSIGMTYAAESYAQTAIVNVEVQNKTVRDVLKEIEKQSSFGFFYDNTLIDLNRRVSVTSRNSDIFKVLEKVFRGTNVTYSVLDKKIVLSTTSAKTVTAQQASYKISGRVVDVNGEAVIGASIMQKGTTNGTITDVDGNFILNVSAKEVTLDVSYIGYSKSTVKAIMGTPVRVVLKEDTEMLDEVVVVGFGTQKKVNLTGSVSTINFNDQLSRPVTNASSALAGLSAGVNVRQTSGNPGNDGATIRIRGLGTLNNSDPLILVDGIEAPMDAINPQDIETISILKDAASSAIYGSRAANGVVLITTRNGSKGKLSVNYNGRMSILNPTRVNKSVSNYVDYMNFMNEGFNQLDQASIFSQTTIDKWTAANKNPNGKDEASGLPNYVVYPNTDWQKEFFNSENGLLQEHNVSLNGGSEKVRFLVSLGYLDNPGLVTNTGIKKYSFRTNFEADVTKWLTLGSRFWANQQNKEAGDFDTAMGYVGQSSPGVYPNYKGTYGGPEAPEERAGNPYLHLLKTLGYNRSNRFNETFYAKVYPFKGLSYEFNFNYERRYNETSNHTNGDMELVRISDGSITTAKTDPSQMITSDYRFNNYHYTVENLLRYHTKIQDHDISALAGHQEYYYYQNGLYTTKKGLLDGNIFTPGSAQEMVSITSKDGNGNETIYDVSTRSFFGRINYGYKDRYLFEANLRYDESSKFSKHHRGGTFPSFSGAWRISEENFMKPISDVLNNLKLRASWGKLGNTNGIGNYASQSTYSTVNYSLGGSQAQGVYSGTLSNPAITWESTAVTNIGIDAGLLNNRLTVELEAYRRFTDGILYAQTLPITVGDKTAPIENLAEVTNKGIELNLGWNDNINGFRYSVSGNVGFNKNIVSKYKGEYKAGWVTAADGTKSWVTNLGDVSTGGVNRVAEGKIINEFYVKSVYKGSGKYYKSDGSLDINGGPRDGMIRTEADMKWLKEMKSSGYYFAPRMNSATAVPSKTTIWYGDYIYADTNGDGVYGNSSDNTFRGESNFPKVNYGLQLSASYKGFDFSMNWAGAGGFSLYWAPNTGYNTPQVRHGVSIPSKIAYNHYFYDPENPSDPRTNINATYGRLINAETGYQNNYESDLYLFKGDYLKLKNVTVGYTLPNAITQKFYAQNVRVYVSGENLWTITDYPGVDPEMGAGVGYSTVRQIAFGLNVTF